MTHNPTQSRRSALKTIGAATLTVVTAGCLTSDDDDHEPRESTVTNNIDEFDITNIEAVDNTFTITITNTGDAEAHLSRYEFEVVTFETNGDEYTRTSGSPVRVTIPSGETREFDIPIRIDPDLVSWHELTVSCLDRDGAYCD